MEAYNCVNNDCANYLGCANKRRSNYSGCTTLLKLNLREVTHTSLPAESSRSWSTTVGWHQMHLTVGHLHLFHSLVLHAVLGHQRVDMFYS